MELIDLYKSDRLESDGYTWDRLTPDETSAFAIACDVVIAESSSQFGIRDPLGRSADLRFLTERFLYPIARRQLSSRAFLVRSTLFDKPQTANWAVPWHQDVTIEVVERHDIAGFGPWSMKDDIVSVQPLAKVLQNMLTLRLHLDPADAENGALLVEPGSHLHGKLRIQDIVPTEPLLCSCEAGEILMMKPLLFHASNRSTSGHPRRVLHLDFAYEQLPHPLVWRSQG